MLIKMACSILMNGLYLNILVNKIFKKFTIIFFLLLVKIKIEGHELPNTLPDHLVPPSKRHLVTSSSSGNNGIYPSIPNSSIWFEWFENKIRLNLFNHRFFFFCNSKNFFNKTERMLKLHKMTDGSVNKLTDDNIYPIYLSPIKFQTN